MWVIVESIDFVRVIGARAEVEIDLTKDKVMPDDLYFLSTDGITDPLSNDEIARVLLNTSIPFFDKCRVLAALAEEAGGLDDKTAILVWA